MTSSRPPVAKHLQIVPAPQRAVELPTGTQLGLPLEPPGRLFVVNMTVTTKIGFVGFLKRERPRVLVDLRLVPSFSLDAFSRRAAFQLFEQCEVKYFDLGRWSSDGARGSIFDLANFVADRVTEALNSLRVEPDGVGLLLESSAVPAWTTMRMHEAIRPRPKAGWKLEVVPRAPLAAVR